MDFKNEITNITKIKKIIEIDSITNKRRFLNIKAKYIYIYKNYKSAKK